MSNCNKLTHSKHHVTTAGANVQKRTTRKRLKIIMTVRSILRMGDPMLLQKCQPLTAFDTLELHALIGDMKETMVANDGAGLAAIQIGVPVRLVIFGVEENPRYPDSEEVPFTILINPDIKPLSEQKEPGWEGCLSVPGMRGEVPRYTHIHYSGFDEFGNRIDREVEGFHARVVQHECDHLDGILYPQIITDMTTFGFTDELVRNKIIPILPDE